MPKRIGLFGGTFDPPHIGHLVLAAEAVSQFKLDTLLWMLTPDPPHKQGNNITPLEHRLSMLQSVIDHNPVFQLSRLEIDRPGPHYTLDTVRALARAEKDAEIFLLIGGDSLKDLPTWRFSTDLVAEVSKIGVMRRPNESTDLGELESQIPGVTKKVQFLNALVQSISSSEIRRRVSAGEMYRYYLAPAVYEYIETHQLYR